MADKYTGWKEIVPFVHMGGARTLRRMAKDSGFPLHKEKRRVFVLEAEVEAWLRDSPVDKHEIKANNRA